jgi:Acetyltransferase (GNAT) domain
MPGAVRPFVDTDVPEVADLHRRVFHPPGPAGNGSWSNAYRRYFSDVFLNQAFCDGRIPSLVYEHDGRIRGFLGVMPRRMCFNGRPVLMAVCSQFAVDAGERGQAGLRMLKRCLAGPQDLTITDEASDATRQMWEWCGGERVLPHSMRWIRLLRPVQWGLSMLARHRSLRVVAGALAADARMIDGLIAKLAPVAFRPMPVRGHCHELDEETFLEGLREIAVVRSLRPCYDAESARWMFDRARMPSAGPVRRLVVRRDNGAIAGWFVYHTTAERVADVLQIAARPEAIADVLDHVLNDAATNRAIAVSGRLEPHLMPALATRRAFLDRGNHWTLLHASDPQVRYAVQAGDSFLTRLEGEWCLRFR